MVEDFAERGFETRATVMIDFSQRLDQGNPFEAGHSYFHQHRTAVVLTNSVLLPGNRQAKPGQAKAHDSDPENVQSTPPRRLGYPLPAV